MADTLRDALTNTRRRGIGVALQQLERRTFESDERWWIDAVRKVTTNGSNRGPIAYAKTRRMHGIVEVLQIFLVKTER